MAKLAYTKLGAKINSTVNKIELGENIVEIRQYLSVNEKLDLIGRVIELAHDMNYNFSNPLKTEVYFVVEVIRAYTNINFTEKQLEEPQKIYDALQSSGILDSLLLAIPEKEMKSLRHNLAATQRAYYLYRNSLIGLLEQVSTDYSDLDLDITELQKKLANGENIELVKNIIDKLG